MIPYWLLLLMPAFGALAFGDARRHGYRNMLVPLLLFTLLAIIMIGTRQQVGGDWYNYLRIYDSFRYLTFEEAFLVSDPGYALLNWWMQGTDWGIYGVNLICGAIFMFGLTAFSLRLPNPWVAMLVAVPYLIVVVAMGYTRQATAIGFEFLALNALRDKRYLRFYLLVVLGTLFHKTAIALLLVGLVTGFSGRYILVRIVIGAIVTYLAAGAFIVDYYESLVHNYVDAHMQSAGALIRVFMNAVPALIFLLLLRRWRQYEQVELVWFIFAFVSLACIPLLAVASTAVDRMALYLAPLQLYVWAHLPQVMRASWVRLAIVAYSASVMFVWLNFAVHAQYWLPYQSILFMDLI